MRKFKTVVSDDTGEQLVRDTLFIRNPLLSMSLRHMPHKAGDRLPEKHCSLEQEKAYRRANRALYTDDDQPACSTTIIKSIDIPLRE